MDKVLKNNPKTMKKYFNSSKTNLFNCHMGMNYNSMIKECLQKYPGNTLKELPIKTKCDYYQGINKENRIKSYKYMNQDLMREDVEAEREMKQKEIIFNTEQELLENILKLRERDQNKFKSELKNELKNEIKSELKEELKEEEENKEKEDSENLEENKVKEEKQSKINIVDLEKEKEEMKRKEFEENNRRKCYIGKIF